MKKIIMLFVIGVALTGCGNSVDEQIEGIKKCNEAGLDATTFGCEREIICHQPELRGPSHLELVHLKGRVSVLEEKLK